MAFNLKHHEEISARITEVYTSIEKLTQLLCYEPNIDEEVSDPLSDARIAISEAAVALQNRAQRDALVLENKIRELYNLNEKS